MIVEIYGYSLIENLEVFTLTIHACSVSTLRMRAFFNRFSQAALQFGAANTVLPVAVILLFKVLRGFGMPWQFQTVLAIAFVIALFCLNIYFWRRLKGWRWFVAILMFLNVFSLFIIREVSFFTAILSLLTLGIPTYIALFG